MTLPALQRTEIELKKVLFLHLSKNMRQASSQGRQPLVNEMTDIPPALRMFYILKKASDEKRSFGTDRLSELALEPELVLKQMTEKDALDLVRANVRLVRAAIEQFGGSLENQGSARSSLFKLTLPEDPEVVQEIENALNPQKKKKEKEDVAKEHDSNPLSAVIRLRRGGFLTKDEIAEFREISGKKIVVDEEKSLFTDTQQKILDVIQQVKGITAEEVAGRVGISIGSVRSHLGEIRHRLEESGDSEYTVVTQRRYQEAGSYHWMSREEAEQFEEDNASMYRIFFGDNVSRIRYDAERQKAQLMTIRKGKHAAARIKQIYGNDVFEENASVGQGLLKGRLLLHAKDPDGIDEDVQVLEEKDLMALINEGTNALDLLVLESAGLVRHVLSQKAMPGDYGEAFLAGLFGLAQAAVNYNDTDFVSKFGNFAKMRISGEMFDYQRSQDTLTRSHRANVVKINEAVIALWTKNGRYPTTEEIAEYTELTTESVNKFLVTRTTRSIEQMYDNVKNESAMPFAETIAGQDVSPEEALMQEEDSRAERETLIKGISNLPEREREVVRLYYSNSLSMKEIANKLGVSETRISQLHSQAISRLRDSFFQN